MTAYGTWRSQGLSVAWVRLRTIILCAGPAVVGTAVALFVAQQNALQPANPDGFVPFGPSSVSRHGQT